jgi:hypothetical protein
VVPNDQLLDRSTDRLQRLTHQTGHETASKGQLETGRAGDEKHPARRTSAIIDPMRRTLREFVRLD